MSDRADKILVKDFVTKKLGSEWLAPTLWFGDQLPPQDQRNWPIPFVIKASHGSAMNVFVRNAAELDWSKIEALCDKWLKETYGQWGAEWLYSRIKPRLLVEPFIGELSTLPIDYKLWTFKGRVQFIQVDTDRETDHKRTMFDVNWNKLPFTTAYPIDQRSIDQPASLQQIIEAAQILSERTSFVRADFYEIGGKPRFGELTFYPDSGWGKFIPREYDHKIGAMWR